MLDEENGIYYTCNKIIDLTFAECDMLSELISNGYISDNNSKYSKGYIKNLVCKLNKKLLGEIVIIRRTNKIYYIKYIGRRKTNEK